MMFEYNIDDEEKYYLPNTSMGTIEEKYISGFNSTRQLKVEENLGDFELLIKKKVEINQKVKKLDKK